MKKIICLIAILPFFVAAAQGEKTDVWKPLRFLVGTWEGRGEGASGESSVVQEYQFIFDGNFLRMTTRSVFAPQEKNPKGEIHEDVGYFSFDGSRKTFILRGFYAEGFVNQYAGKVTEDGKELTFTTESVENAPPGTRAKLVFLRTGEDTLEQSFHVAWPEKEFGCLSTNRLRKKKSPPR